MSNLRAMKAAGWNALRHLLALVVATGLVGCATYRPLPLVTHATLAHRVEHLQGGKGTALPLDEVAVQRLVLLNNPRLAATRARHGVGRAQVLDASTLPNPSVQANLGFLVAGAGDVPAWGASFAQSLQGLIVRGARRDEARASASATDAQLLWESWVTLARARQLVVDVVDGERRLTLRDRLADLIEARAASLRAAVARGDADTGTSSVVFAAAVDARTAASDARQVVQAQRAELSALLGLDAGAPLPLAPLPALGPFDLTQATAAVASMGEHRPDLAALRFAYAAQEARLRGAILSQFPPLSVGVDAARDSSKVLDIGPSASLELPVFDRQQGKIAVAEATRQQLHDEYTARIDETVVEAHALIAAVVAAERAAARTTTDTVAMDAASRAFARGDIDAAIYADLNVAALGQDVDRITRDLYRREQRIALDALTGAGLPSSLPPGIAP
ncbi:TolC family protein [Luteibacter sp. ME-Dv--P-043b]|uniref:TolC family protein n=1 Tax=Luteibacter sp. ME-Dv--P-043b TaxID=3040291 RepID=UPI002553D39C|nr:TolC family protein [Luteibacter sp. ME-Dv--P-043b]